MSETNSTTLVEYRPIEGFPGYRIGNDGSVWSQKRRDRQWRQLRQSRDGGGYMQVGLCNSGKVTSFNVHRLVLLAFRGPCPDGKESAHDNGRRDDNRLDNLFWKTPVENADDILRHGRRLAKATAEQANEVVALLVSGKLTQREISARLGLGFSVVRKIATGQTWKRITGGKRIGRGRGRKGEAHPNAKLTDDQVREIRATPECSEARFAQRFGVSVTTIHCARNLKLWKRVS